MEVLVSAAKGSVCVAGPSPFVSYVPARSASPVAKSLFARTRLNVAREASGWQYSLESQELVFGILWRRDRMEGVYGLHFMPWLVDPHKTDIAILPDLAIFPAVNDRGSIVGSGTICAVCVIHSQ